MALVSISVIHCLIPHDSSHMLILSRALLAQTRHAPLLPQHPFPPSLCQAQEDVRQQLREFEETKKQIEEDEDREIQDIKTKYEKKLRDEKESNLRLKGETGIMRKKVPVGPFFAFLLLSIFFAFSLLLFCFY